NDQPAAGLGRIDLAIQGAATPDALAAWPAMLRRLHPAKVLPSHMDDFFRPLDRGFSFLAMTDFPKVRQLVAENKSDLVMLDYFLRPLLQQLERGGSVASSALLVARRRAINLPWWGSLLAAIGWLLCIPIFLVSLATVPGGFQPMLWWHLPISFLVSGFMAI